MYSTHPNPDKVFLMKTYRAYILGSKKRNGTARSLVHYRDYVREYLTAKKDVILLTKLQGIIASKTELNFFLTTPNSYIDSRKPIDLINTDEEERLFGLAFAFVHPAYCFLTCFYPKPKNYQVGEIG